MSELKPCPFCGEAKLLTVCDNSNRVYLHHPVFGELREPKPDRFWAACMRCGAALHGDTFGYKNEEEAISAWNRRMNNE